MVDLSSYQHETPREEEAVIRDDDDSASFPAQQPRLHGCGLGVLFQKASSAFLVALLAVPLLLFSNSSNFSDTHHDDDASTAYSNTSPTSISASQTMFRSQSSLIPPYRMRRAPLLSMAYASDPLPFSVLTPTDLGLETIVRPQDSAPGQVFGTWRRREDESSDDTATSSNNKHQKQKHHHHQALPTNMWYENLLLGLQGGVVTSNNRAYTIPYIVDFVGPIPGLRVHFPHVLAFDTIVQMSTVRRHGLTLGSTLDVPRAYVVNDEYPPSQLGLGLQWSTKDCGDDDSTTTTPQSKRDDCGVMKTTILRGIPYATMEYSAGMMHPVIAAEVPLVGPPVIDGKDMSDMQCGNLKKPSNDSDRNATLPNVVRVQHEVELTFAESDFRWLVFFSRPVKVSCFHLLKDPNAPPLPPGVVDFSVKSVFELHVVESNMETQPLIVRAALANNCTYGSNPLYCVGGQPRHQNDLGDLLRTHADVYPSHPSIEYEFPASVENEDEVTSARIHFHWNPRSMRKDTAHLAAKEHSRGNHHGSSFIRWKPKTSTPPERYPNTSQELLMYALPHHVDSMVEIVGSSNSETGYCSAGLHGRACLLRGREWVMKEDLDGPPNFAAPRPPHHSAIPSLARAISTDIHFQLPDNYMRGAGDTYFSGKMLAKLGRIIVIASELKGLAATPETDTFDLDDLSQRELKLIVEACRQADLPSEQTMADAIARLRSGVEIWLNGTAEAPFVYDSEWGGLVNCGCLFNGETQSCDNAYPNCPTFYDPGLDFGTGFYNDHHFHAGYHIYAAAVVASFDLAWGRKYFQQVLTLVRDIANPSVYDEYFPQFRQKDWFLGSSWASGIATLGGQPYPNGRNQESSSEAINAYEAIGLYGAAMVHAWGDGISSSVMENDNAVTASRVRDMGRLLTATELRSAKRYWHVHHGDGTKSVYPHAYKPSVVGMMWDTMCQFQTWFGNSPYLAYGIQLMPLTVVAERRDSVPWAQQMYPAFAGSCQADRNCEEQGWSVLQHAMLAVVGHRQLALERANALPPSVFEAAGGNGHSLTNTLWFIATRPEVAEPLVLPEPPLTHDETEKTKATTTKLPQVPVNLTCGCPETCTPSQLAFDAGGYSCKERIQFLIKSFGKSEKDACRQVAGAEFPEKCRGCDPDRCETPPELPVATAEQILADQVCPPCSSKVCKSEINLCPRSLLAPYLCLAGSNRGGCAQSPWFNYGNTEFCTKCCMLTERCFGV